MLKLTRIEAVKDLVQEIVDKGARSVEEIHRTIADLPLSALEERGLLGENGDQVREAHHRKIGTIYEAIRKVNKEVGDFASGIIESLEDHADADRNIRAGDADEQAPDK